MAEKAVFICLGGRASMDQEDMEMHRKLKFAVIAAFCWAVSFSLPAALLAQRTETEESLKVKVAEAVRMLAVEGIVNYSGHVSARVPGTNRILINSRDASREIVQSENIVTVDLDGNKVAGKEGEPDETWMHLSIYRARPDVMSVVHSHALYSTSFTIARKPMLPVTVRGAIFADGVPEYPEAGKIVNREQGDRLAEALGPHRAALLRMHGAVVVGAYLEEAFAATIQFEENAQYQLTASMLGPVDRLTPQEVEDSVRESWKPNSILKRWEYYRAKEIRANPGLQEEKLQSSAR